MNQRPFIGSRGLIAGCLRPRLHSTPGRAGRPPPGPVRAPASGVRRLPGTIGTDDGPAPTWSRTRSGRGPPGPARPGRSWAGGRRETGGSPGSRRRPRREEVPGRTMIGTGKVEAANRVGPRPRAVRPALDPRARIVHRAEAWGRDGMARGDTGRPPCPRSDHAPDDFAGGRLRPAPELRRHRCPLRSGPVGAPVLPGSPPPVRALEGS